MLTASAFAEAQTHPEEERLSLFGFLLMLILELPPFLRYELMNVIFSPYIG